MKKKRKKTGPGTSRTPTTNPSLYFLGTSRNFNCQVKTSGDSLQTREGNEPRLSTFDTYGLESPLLSFFSRFGSALNDLFSRVLPGTKSTKAAPFCEQPVVGVKSHSVRRTSRRSLAVVTGAILCVDLLTLGYGHLWHVLESSE